VVPSGVALLLTAKMFYANDIGRPLLWMAIYAALSRKTWGILIMILVFGCARDETSKLLLIAVDFKSYFCVH
jgi:hypothetical protein